MENNTKHTQDEKINLSDLKIFHFQATAKKWIWKVTTPESDLIADTYDKEHAEFIVKACNNHYALVDALKKLYAETVSEYGDTNAAMKASELLNQLNESK